jgi:phage terminase small subunit
MSAYHKLTEKQRRFVDLYVVSLNGTQAAREAGYGPVRADVAAARLKGRPLVRAAIAERQVSRREDAELNAEWVLERLRAIVERCMQAEPARERFGKPTGEWKFDAAGAARALELIGRHLAMFTDNVNLRDLDKLADDELDRRIAELQRQAGSVTATH